MAESLDKEQVQKLLDDSPYIGFMKLEVISMNLEEDTIVIRMPMRPEFERRRGTGQYHGGAIAALIDIAGDYALVMKVGGGVPTINFRVDFLRPGTYAGSMPGSFSVVQTLLSMSSRALTEAPSYIKFILLNFNYIT